MLIRDCSKKEISEYLNNIESDYMGLTGNTKQAEPIVDLLIEWKEKIIE